MKKSVFSILLLLFLASSACAQQPIKPSPPPQASKEDLQKELAFRQIRDSALKQEIRAAGAELELNQRDMDMVKQKLQEMKAKEKAKESNKVVPETDP